MSAVADDLRMVLLDAADAVAPCIRAHGDEIERERRIVGPVVDALHERGLFRMLLPRSLGGWEVDPVTFVSVIEAVARHDASTAWCLCQGSGCSMISAYVDHRIGEQIFGADPRAVLAWGQPQGARAVPVDGGYRLTARWMFASGSHHATWLGGISPVFEPDDSPRLRDDGTQDSRYFLFPAPDARLIDVWQVSGLRGTGSDTIAVDDLFVPRERTTRQAPDERREQGPLYRFLFTHLYASGFSSVAQGVARGMLDAFVELAAAKTARGTSGALRENAVIQAQVGRAEAMLGSARAYLHATLDDAWREVNRTGALTLAQRVRIRLASTFGAHQAMSVADTLFHAAGSSAIFTANPFERRFRDIHAVSQQVQARQTHFETVGQFLLGLEPDQGFL
ncbi:MAG: acyl-CoA dehydrogenase family protein [Chloroflexota bacterium]|nr:acyl-CoA dehydrogenase family protein [Chloroflexota bacterium]